MATTVSRLEVELTLDDKDFRMAIKGSTAELAKFKSVIGSTNKGMKQQESTLKSMTASFRHTVVTLGLLREALRTAWQATGGLVTGIVNVAAEFERLNVLLAGMSKGVTEIERATDAADQFNQVIDMAKAAPFTVKELTNSWVKFKSVGVDPATGSLKSLVDAVARFGGTDDILHRATIAVQQMAGKGVISMEELRQQMGEAVPQALVLLARGMNMSVGDMVDAISKGTVEATSALGKLFAEFSLTFGGASQKLMETYIGSLSRLRTVWQLTLNEIGNSSGLFQEVKRVLQELIVQLDNPVIRRFGIDVGVFLKRAFLGLESVILKAIDIWKEFGEEIKRFVVFMAAYRTAVILATAATKNFVAAASMGVLAGAATRIKEFVQALIAFRSVTFATSIAVSGLGTAIKALFLSNPVGWIALIVGALASWAFAQRDVTEATISGVEALERYRDAATELNIQQAKDDLAKQKEIISKRKAMVELIRNNAIAQGVTDDENVKKAFQVLQGEIVVLEARAEKTATLISEVTEGAYRRAAEAAARAMEQQFRDGMSLARNSARAQDQDIDTLFRNGEINEKERLERRLVVWQKFAEQQKVFVTEQIAEQMQIIRDADAVQLGTAEANVKKEWAVKKEIALEGIRQIGVAAVNAQSQLNNDLANIQRDNNFITGSDKLIADQKKGLEQFIATSSGKLASLNAQLMDGQKETEKFLAMVSANKFGAQDSWPQAMKDLFEQALAIIKEIDQAAEDLAAKKAFESAMKTAEKQLAKTSEEAEIFREAVDAGLNEVPNNRVRRFRRNLAALRATLVLTTEQAEEFDRVSKEILAGAQGVSSDEKILEIRKQISDLDVLAIENARERFTAEQELLDQQFQSFLLTNAEAENLEQLKQVYDELREKKREAFENNQPIMKMLREWEDVMGQMEEAGAMFIDQFADKFTDALIEGKFAFADFAKEILKELLKILIRAMITRAVMSFMGGGQIQEIDMSTLPAPKLAMGGIFGPDGPVESYARGGIATKPQVAIFGEGDQNEAFVPLPDGRSIPVSMSGGRGEAPNVTVNVINESGEPVEAEETGSSFDGENFILDVVLKAAHRPGNFRDGLNAAVK